MKIFANKLTHTLLYLIVFSMMGCSDLPPKQDTGIITNSQKNESIKEKEEGKQEEEGIEEVIGKEEEEEEKTDAEAIIDIGQTTFETGKDLWDTKKKNDSIRMSKRDKMYAYQLGVPFRKEELLLNAYEKLPNVDHVLAFKRSKKDYLLIIYEGKDVDQLAAELNTYKNEYSGQITGEIKIIDLMMECGLRKKPIATKNIKKRKNNIRIDCLTCSR